jgi:hypothetical protein
MRTDVKGAVLAAACWALVGCGSDGDADPGGGVQGVMCPSLPASCPSSGETRYYLLNTLDFGKVDPTDSTVAPGFNLDGHVTEAGDTTGCGRQDFVSPEGEPGIDNQIAMLATELEALLGGSLQRRVDQGRVLLLLEVSDVDDFHSDACVTLGLMVGALPDGMTEEDLLRDADGHLAPGQEIPADPTSLDATGQPLTRVPACIREGTLHAGPVPVRLKIEVGLDNPIDLQLHQTLLRAGITPETISDGVLGGALNLQELAEAAEAVEDGIGTTVCSILPFFADLGEEGGTCLDTASTCASISTTLVFGGVPAERADVD